MAQVRLNVVEQKTPVKTPAKARRKIVISDADIRWLIRNHTASCHACGKNYRCQVYDYS